MIDRLIRNAYYFKDKLDKEDKNIYPNDFDSQFNEISNYLNNTLKPEIDSIIVEAENGVAGSARAYLHNVGDGTTNWQMLSNEQLADFSIPLTAIGNAAIGSVLTTDSSGNIVALAPTGANEVLVSSSTAVPHWRLLINTDFKSKTLTGAQFGVLGIENFQENQFITVIAADVIATANIVDSAITGEKIQDQTVTSEKLGIFADLPVVLDGLTPDNIADGALGGNKVIDGNIPTSSIFNDPNVQMDIWDYYELLPITTGGASYAQILRSNQILDSSIEDTNLAVLMDNLANLPFDQVATAAQAFFNNVSLTFQFQKEHFALDKISANLFDAEVTAAIDRLPL